MHLCLQSRPELGEPVLCYSAVCVCLSACSDRSCFAPTRLHSWDKQQKRSWHLFLSSLSLHLCQRSLFLSLIISALKTHVRDVKTQVIVGLSTHQVRSWANPSAGGTDGRHADRHTAERAWGQNTKCVRDKATGTYRLLSCFISYEVVSRACVVAQG